jgi:predicted NAD/FAD-binding protein
LFGQRKNLLNFHFWRLLRDVIRFYREAERSGLLMPPEVTVREFLRLERYSQAFVDMHLIPMISAIWSTSGKSALDTPISTVVKFFANHGLLKLRNRPTWRTVFGGSQVYVWRLLNGTKINLQLGSHIRSISRPGRRIIITNAHGETRQHDTLVLATHADQALSLLANPSDQEQQILGKFLYEKNKVVLHSDHTQMPSERRVWSSWNVKQASTNFSPVTVTYWINKLQSLNCDNNYFVSLNPSSIDSSAKLHKEFFVSHPILDSQMTLAQRKLNTIQGENNTWFCGSYFGYGFHEDALVSGLEVAEALGAQRPWLRSADRNLNPHIRLPQNSPVL